jgi:hypothetical protein
MTHGKRDEDDSAVEQDDDLTEGNLSDDDAATAERDVTVADEDRRRSRPEAAHLADVEDGCGCAEVWEHLSERRAADSD